MTKKELNQKRRRVLAHFGGIFTELSRKPKKIVDLNFGAETSLRCDSRHWSYPAVQDGDVTLTIEITMRGELLRGGPDFDEPHIKIKEIEKRSPRKKK